MIKAYELFESGEVTQKYYNERVKSDLKILFSRTIFSLDYITDIYTNNFHKLRSTKSYGKLHILQIHERALEMTERMLLREQRN